jgi:hypothetical protein
LEKIILNGPSGEMDNLEWPHLEVLKAACRIDTSSGKYDHLKGEASEWIRIFTKLQEYIFISLCNGEYSKTAIEILNTFTWKFVEIRDKCLDSSLTIMIKTLGLIYKPDIDEECKENIQEYLYKIYFDGEDSQT